MYSCLITLLYATYLIPRMHLTHLDASIVWCACLACMNWVHPIGTDASIGWWSTDRDASNLLKLLSVLMEIPSARTAILRVVMPMQSKKGSYPFMQAYEAEA